MDTYWFNVNAILWLVVAALPVASATTTRICYNSFGTVVCRNRLPVHERVAFWIVGMLLLGLTISSFIYCLRRRASRQRDSIATIESNQINGPPPTPFESGFVQVQGRSVTYPAVPPYTNAYGPRTAAAPQSAYSVGFTPARTAKNIQPRSKASYSSSQYSTSPEDAAYAPPPSSARGIRTAGAGGLPGSPRPIFFPKRAQNEQTPRDKNTRFIIPELPLATHRKDRGRELEALRTAPIKKISFDDVPSTPERPMQSRSAGVTSTFTSKLKPLFTGTRFER
jgi:hypothetical protein